MSTDTPPPTETGTHPQQASSEKQAESDELTREPSHALSLDHVFEILKNERRREVLHYLRDREDRVTLSDLAEHIAALENDTDVASITSSQRKRVYVGLYQCHLPKMADMDIVDFNQNRGIVEIGENAPQLFQYLDNDGGTARDWYRYYLAIAGLGAVTVVGNLALGVPSGAGLLALLALVTVLIGGCAVLDGVAQGDESTREQLQSVLPF